MRSGNGGDDRNGMDNGTGDRTKEYNEQREEVMTHKKNIYEQYSNYFDAPDSSMWMKN